MSSAMARSSWSMSCLARASTASRRGSRPPVSRATSGGSASERSSAFMRRTTSAAALRSVGVSWAAPRQAVASTRVAKQRERCITRSSGAAGGAGKLRHARATRYPRGPTGPGLEDDVLPRAGLVLQAGDPAGDVQHLVRPAAGEMLLELLAVAPGVQGVVLVQVVVELEVRRGGAVGVFEAGDLGAGGRLAVGHAPAECTLVQRRAVEKGANCDALGSQQELLLPPP